MRLQALDRATAAIVADWIADAEIHQWLDFGNGRQTVGADLLLVMNQQDTHVLRLVVTDDETPVALVALSNVSAPFGTANLWYLLGDGRYGRKGYVTRAVGLLLDEAFETLGLRSVSAWAVEANTPSIRVLERNGFRAAGRLRSCHVIDSTPHDRLLFDLVAEEHLRARTGTGSTAQVEERGHDGSPPTRATPGSEHHTRILSIFRERLHMEVEGGDADLLDAGLIDSLALVELVVGLEDAFGVEIGPDELDFDNFRSVNAIAELVSRLLGRRVAA